MDATAPMTLVVLVTLRAGVGPEAYERWVTETYRPAVLALPSVSDWRGYRTSGLLASDGLPPCDYVVTVDVNDPEGLGRDMARGEMQGLLARVHELAEVVQMLSTRFA